MSGKQSFKQFLVEFENLCEVVYIDEEGNQLDEAAIRAFKRSGREVKRYYRCTSGSKAGRLVAEPKACAIRKEPQKVRHGRKVMRKKKNVINQKSRITKRTSLSKLIKKKNLGLSKTHKATKQNKD